MNNDHQAQGRRAGGQPNRPASAPIDPEATVEDLRRFLAGVQSGVAGRGAYLQ